MHRVSLVAVVLTLTPLHAVSAQDRDRSPLPPGTSIRLSTRGRAMLQGRLLERRGDTLVVDRSGDRLLVFVGNVEALWVRGTAAKTGAIVGAVPLALLGAYSAVVLAGVCQQGHQEKVGHYAMQGVAYDGREGCLPGGVAALLGGLAGATVGAVLGAGIGALIPTWRHRSFPGGFRVSLEPRGHRFGFNASLSF